MRQDNGVVEIKSNTLVPAGQRVRPGDLKAVLASPDELPLLQNDFNNQDHAQRATHGWRFTGIEMTVNNTKGYLNYGLIVFGFGDNPTIVDIPHDIAIQRCYIHGDGTSNYIKRNNRKCKQHCNSRQLHKWLRLIFHGSQCN